MNRNVQSALLALLIALLLPATALAGGRMYGRDTIPYTQADYDQALSLMTAGYEDMPVAKFDRLVLDWDDEEAYHLSEAVLARVLGSLKDDDPHADFILGTLANAWDACEVRHYNACARARNPWHGGHARYELHGDVFGDDVLLFGAYIDFRFNYAVPDETALTVGRRDAIFEQVEAAMEAYLKGQTREAMRDEQAMERKLAAALENTLLEVSEGLRWAGKLDLEYYFDEPYAFSWEMEGAEEAWTETYTRAQYDDVLAKLMPSGYEDMSVAAFDRHVHQAFMDGDERDDLNFAYEMVCANLPDGDPNAFFLTKTVPRALEEYAARVKEVYTGKTADMSCSAWASVEQEADVYGDKVTVGMVEADYTFTYRLLDADRLTVRERDAFLAAVEAGAKAYIQEALTKEGATKAGLEAGLRAAGEAAGNEKILFTGCRVDYLEYMR